MNKIYRLIWSSAQRAWVVVGELSSAQGKGKTRAVTSTIGRSGLAIGVLTAAMLSAPAEAWTVDAGSVRNGSATAANDNAITTNTAIGSGSQTTTDAAGQSTAIHHQ
ncbi:ESPR domain-containing protein [Jinshanibacter sp. LJY008]|uniref:ESPR domain-containing protein n=1 Tax=Limnobaculum eriocheiris TaxID=2897391 RepID=A0A9X1MW81_9GAMM|nr:ESPR-type extended signal peptide-containing protein [Limnobaculum eriocheiris]MCD1125897.1 ESPR domain-containing protein [Limnobaculum eriocheiris]